MKKTKINNTDQRAHIDPLELVNSRLEEVMLLSREIKESKESKKSHTFQKLPKHLKRRQMSTNPARIKKSFKRGLEKVSTYNTKTRKRSYDRKPSRFSLYRNRMNKNNINLETHIWHAKRFHMSTLNSFKLPLKRVEKTFRFSLNSALKNENRNDSIVFDTSYFHYFLNKPGNNTSISCFTESFLETKQFKLERLNHFYIYKRNIINHIEDSSNLGLLLNTYRIIGKGAFRRLGLFLGFNKTNDLMLNYKSTKKDTFILRMNYANFIHNKEKEFEILEDTNVYNNRNNIEKLVDDYECGKDKMSFLIEIIVKITYIEEYGSWDLEVILPANYGKIFWMAINKYMNAYGGLYELRYIHAVMNKKLAPFDFISSDHFKKETTAFQEEQTKRIKRRNKMEIEESSYSLTKQNGLFSIKIENGCHIKGKPQRGGFLYYKINSDLKSKDYREAENGKLRICNKTDTLDEIFKLIGYIYYDNYDLVRGRNFGMCCVDSDQIKEKDVGKVELYYRNRYDSNLFYKCIYKEVY